MSLRKFSATELNHLNKYGFDYLKYLDSAMPVEYITGIADFRDLEFIVNSNVLIPRVETAQIIDIALEFIDSKKNLKLDTINFADIGCGSGAIGISFAYELIKQDLSFNGTLTDVSESALEITKANIKKVLDDSVSVIGDEQTNDIDSKKIRSIDVYKSNLFENHANESYDIIFANLPYIPTKRVEQLDNSVKDFEPSLALDGGVDGLDLIKKLIHQAHHHIIKDGILILEVDDSHTDASEFLNEWKVKIVNDINNKNRFWILNPIV